jgi:hypothetical protein
MGYNTPGKQTRISMKSYRIKSHILITIGVLIVFVLLSALNFPSNPVPAQSEPTPTATPDPRIDPEALQPGDTQGLMIGAAVILVIILAGVLFQRLRYTTSQNKNDVN